MNLKPIGFALTKKTDCIGLKADEILHSVNAADSDALAVGPHSQQTPNKKERRILKHELFIQRKLRSHLIMVPFPRLTSYFRLISPPSSGGLGNPLLIASLSGTTRTT